MTGQGDLYGLAQELLAVSSAALASTPAGAPPQSYISIGSPAYDCEQLTVHVSLVQKDTWSPNQAPGDAYHKLRGGSVNLVQLVVTALRCVPVMESIGAGMQVPSPAQFDTAAAECYADGWALWNTVQGRFRAGALFASFPCREVLLGPLQPVNPQGGLAGYVLSLIVQLDGYGGA